MSANKITQALTEDAELQEAIVDWVPWWRRPKSQEEWDKLVEQRSIAAAYAIKTYKKAVKHKMPQWFIEMVAKTKYHQIRRYKRTKRRAEIERLWPTWSPEERLMATIKYDL